MHARVGLELEDRALGVGLDGLGAEPDPAGDLLGVEALGQQLEDLALALGQRRVGAGLVISSAGDSDGSTNGLPAATVRIARSRSSGGEPFIT